MKKKSKRNRTYIYKWLKMDPNINNEFIIKIKKNLDDLNDDDILNIYCRIKAFIIEEIKNGNMIEKSWLYIKYKSEFKNKKYINIIRIIKEINLYDFKNYFKNFKKNMLNQNYETKLNINDYLFIKEETSQKIVIKMSFNIKTKNEKIKEKEKKIKEILEESNILNKINEI